MTQLSSSESNALIMLAAGGTGGHVFPAEALACELLGRGLKVAVVTDKRGGSFGKGLNVPVHTIHAAALGKTVFGKVQSLCIMAIGVIQALILFKRLKPQAIVGFGGYPSVPALYAAAQLNIPIILHEQNAVLGRANRVMMGMAKTVALSFPHVMGLASSSARFVHTGNPVRPAFAALRGTPYTPLVEEGPFRILVMGGSLGAKVFSHVVPHAIGLMPEHLRRRLVITQQCREDDMETARAAFAGAGVDVDLAPFFHDVPERMATAHLVITRSGGSTVAEVTAIGRPAIFVPYPHGHAGEQVANAEAVAEAGGAWLIPEKSFTPEALAVRIESLMTLPDTLLKTAAAARAWGRTTAADHLATCVVEALSPAPSTSGGQS